MSARQDSRETNSDELPLDHHYVVISSDSHAGADILDSLRATVQRCVEDCPEGALHADT
jgi:ferredoxin